jgi:hypothetical protein
VRHSNCCRPTWRGAPTRCTFATCASHEPALASLDPARQLAPLEAPPCPCSTRSSLKVPLRPRPNGS